MTPVLRLLTALGCGVIFGFGLSLSGMLDPQRVTGFLDITGHWDPSLAFVLGGAVLAATVAYRLTPLFGRPAFDNHYALPVKTRIDRPLLLGSALFGIGWGLAGFCPGPAIASLVLGYWPSVLFVAAMAAGMILHDRGSSR